MTIEVEDFDVNDIIIRMKPNFTDEGRWDGFIDMDIITDNKKTTEPSDFIQLMQVASLICSALPVMEIDEEFRNTLCDYASSMIEEDDKKYKEERIKESVASTTGNVIKVKF